MLRFSTGRALSPHLERTRLKIGSHELDDLTGGKLELLADGVESSAIFPRHLYNSVDLFRLKLKLLGWHDLTSFIVNAISFLQLSHSFVGGTVRCRISLPAKPLPIFFAS